MAKLAGSRVQYANLTSVLLPVQPPHLPHQAYRRWQGLFSTTTRSLFARRDAACVGRYTPVRGVCSSLVQCSVISKFPPKTLLASAHICCLPSCAGCKPGGQQAVNTAG